jgi:two-component system, LuxR family, response regulator FixJ
MPDDPLICIVEDDAPMRDALQLLLRSAGFSVQSYPSAESFLAEMDITRALCLLADVRLPGMDGIALHRHLVALGADPTVVIITGNGDISMAVAALKNGVADFVEKPFDPALLVDIIQEALQRAIAKHRCKAVAADITRRRLALTPREAEILALLAEGHPNKVVAGRLGISTRTIEHHRAHIMEKMQARSFSQLIRMVLATDT